MALKVDRRIVFVDLNDVLAVKAEGNYVLLLCKVGSHLLRESISVLENRLEPYGFIRVHRSVLINGAFVEEIRPLSTGEYALRLKGGKDFTVTRNYKKRLKSLADLWVGSERFLQSLDTPELRKDSKIVSVSSDRTPAEIGIRSSIEPKRADNFYQ